MKASNRPAPPTGRTPTRGVFDMEVKKPLTVVAALAALGIAGPAIANAHDDGNSDDSSPVTTAAPVTHEGQSAADEQQSGDQGDVENTDLATQVEEADGANGQQGANEEDQVGDGA